MQVSLESSFSDKKEGKITDTLGMFHSVLNVKVGSETINSTGRGSGKSEECQGYCFVRYRTYRYSNKTYGFSPDLDRR